MSFREELPHIVLPKDTLLTIGVFDGVHRGHQYLIRRLKEEAARRNLISTVFTFRNHPRTVLEPGLRLGYITLAKYRQELLRDRGVDLVLMVEFTPEVAQATPREFVSVLQERLRMRGLVVGPGFALGRGRQGDVATLQSLGREMGFDVVVVEAQTEDGEMVSSSSVRTAIVQGDVEKAARLLGRPFTLEGEVVTGAGRGTSLGFPTANLKPDPDRIVPGDGIYATWVLIGGERHPAATSIGVRPTFDQGPRSIETYIMDFGGDLYGKEIAIQFIKRLRGEVKFDTAEALKRQIGRDVEQARAALS